MECGFGIRPRRDARKACEVWNKAVEQYMSDMNEVCQNPAKIDPFWDEFGSELTRDGDGFPGGPGEPRGV